MNECYAADPIDYSDLDNDEHGPYDDAHPCALELDHDYEHECECGHTW